tara:strand:+ start:1614 stop:3644 length:2031 start_codon:yes stop_codon:yes gene_type:complete
MEFEQFAAKIAAHVQQMCKDTTHLFQVTLDKKFMWELYLSSFKDGDNEIYKERTEHDCQCCHSFIKHFGNVVAIQDGKVVTVWDVEDVGEKYQPVVDALAEYVRSYRVSEVFTTETRKFGTVKNLAQTEEGGTITWHHFHAALPKTIKTYKKDTIGTQRGQLRDTRNVLHRSLEEISLTATETILELIAQRSLYKGEEWDAVLRKFRTLQKEYATTEEKELYCWTKSLEVGPVVGRIRSHSIGTLLTNLSEGMPLDTAVKKYEAIVAPHNYKRPKAIFTKSMVKAAAKQVEELGLGDSLARRHAVLDDITLPNIIFANPDATRIMGGGDAFAELATEASGKPQDFSRLDEVGVDTFVKKILPTATSVELYLENGQTPNMVSLVAPQHAEAPSMFKWDNPFSWSYAGNITDSMKERVKAQGGKVDGVLRFSIQWNDGDNNQNDFDAHCHEPNGNLISYMNRNRHVSKGNLDVDIVNPGRNVAVENITWPIRSKMQRGTYRFLVHNYSHNGGRTGFTAEIEYDGQLYSFAYDKELRPKEKVDVAEVTMLPSGEFTINEKLLSSVSSREVWGLKTNEFHPVSVVMFSPNYWDGQDKIGHRHYFLMLDGCRNDEEPNGFFNEFLREDLMKQKRVFEALGAKMRVEASPNQLSGVGFSATKSDSFVCKVGGKFTRTIRVVI